MLEMLGTLNYIIIICKFIEKRSFIDGSKVTKIYQNISSVFGESPRISVITLCGFVVELTVRCGCWLVCCRKKDYDK